MNAMHTKWRRALLQAAGAGMLGASMLLAPAAASAATYEGYGDTGWSHDNKRDCCEDAVWLAQDNAAASCEDAGGQPKLRSGSARGSCDWDADGNSFDRVYRCKARARVECR
jgi:hypothetical protein